MRKGADAPRAALLEARDSGFTLLEVVIALAIAALALGVLFETGATSVRATRTAARIEHAISLARSRLALAARSTPLAPGDWQGEEGSGFHWHLRVRAAAAMTPEAPLPGARSSPLTLYAISVSVSWPQEGAWRDVQLQTARLGRISR